MKEITEVMEEVEKISRTDKTKAMEQKDEGN